MLLKNYFQLLSDISQLYQVDGAIDFSTSIKNLSGTALTLRYNPYRNLASIPIALPNTFQNCIIGSSDDPVSFDDYCLKSQIADFSVSLIQTIPSQIKDGYEKFTIVIFGKVATDCTVREIGLTKNLYTTSGEIQECLMLRHVLNTQLNFKLEIVQVQQSLMKLKNKKGGMEYEYN